MISAAVLKLGSEALCSTKFEPFSFCIVRKPRESQESCHTVAMVESPTKQKHIDLEHITAVNKQFSHSGMYQLNINPTDNKK